MITTLFIILEAVGERIFIGIMTGLIFTFGVWAIDKIKSSKKDWTDISKDEKDEHKKNNHPDFY